MDILQKLGDTIRMVFSDLELTIGSKTTANDVEGWDSLSHITLITTVEACLGIRFSNKEILTFRNVGEMMQLINVKLNNK